MLLKELTKIYSKNELEEMEQNPKLTKIYFKNGKLIQTKRNLNLTIYAILGLDTADPGIDLEKDAGIGLVKVLIVNANIDYYKNNAFGRIIKNDQIIIKHNSNIQASVEPSSFTSNAFTTTVAPTKPTFNTSNKNHNQANTKPKPKETVATKSIKKSNSTPSATKQ